MTTRAKICGITRHEDAELAVSLGAWALGFILWPGSPRVADPAVAAGIARDLRRKVNLVGVFVSPTLDEVAEAVDLVGLSHVQLHGDEGPAFCSEVARRTGAKVIKAVNVESGADVQHLDVFRAVDLHLLDGRTSGGGEPFAWALATRHVTKVPLMLSGGLTAENVQEAIAIVKPYAVDVASGVESEPGIKDPAKLEAFMRTVWPQHDQAPAELEQEPEQEPEQAAEPESEQSPA